MKAERLRDSVSVRDREWEPREWDVGSCERGREDPATAAAEAAHQQQQMKKKKKGAENARHSLHRNCF